MVIAITGSKGFLGSYLLKRLKESNHDLIEIDSKLGFDITNKADLLDIRKFDCVIHLAGKISVADSFKFPYEYLNQNFLGMLNVLELCRKFDAKLIFASSYIYGEPKYIPVDENHTLNAHNPYSQSKIICEQLCQGYNSCFGIKCISLRLFNIYGPKMNSEHLIPTILKQATNGKIELLDIRPRRDYVYVNDVIDAFIASIKYDNKKFSAFNISSGISHSAQDIIDILISKLSKKIQIINLNRPRSIEILDVIGDSRKAKTQLGWEPKTNFKDGMIKLIDYYYESNNNR
jgi:nucleoside-diphosphate-sugar epimerase